MPTIEAGYLRQPEPLAHRDHRGAGGPERQVLIANHELGCAVVVVTSQLDRHSVPSANEVITPRVSIKPQSVYSRNALAGTPVRGDSSPTVITFVITSRLVLRRRSGALRGRWARRAGSRPGRRGVAPSWTERVLRSRQTRGRRPAASMRRRRSALRRWSPTAPART